MALGHHGQSQRLIQQERRDSGQGTGESSIASNRHKVSCSPFFCSASSVSGSRYSLRPKNTVVLAFKICPTKSIYLACIKINLIQTIPSIEKKLYRKEHRTNQMLSRFYFSSSNAYAFIEDPGN